MANIPVSTAIDNLLKSTPSTTVTTAAALTALGAAVKGDIVNADISATAAIADTKLAPISTAGKVSNSATTAASANTASAIVARDGSGNFIATTITAALTGNASTATTSTNLASGTAGAIPYQSAAGTTGFSAAGTAGQVLVSGGTSAPTWGAAGSTPADGSITTAKLADGAVTAAKFATSTANADLSREVFRLNDDEVADSINWQPSCVAKIAALTNPLRIIVAGDSLSTSLSIPPNMMPVGVIGLSRTSAVTNVTSPADFTNIWIAPYHIIGVGGSAVYHAGTQGAATAVPIMANTLMYAYIAESGAGSFDIAVSSDGGSTYGTPTNVNASNVSQIGVATTLVLSTTNNPRYVARINNVTTGSVKIIAIGLFQSTGVGAIHLRGLANLQGIDVVNYGNVPDAIFTPIWTALAPDLVVSHYADGPEEWQDQKLGLTSVVTNATSTITFAAYPPTTYAGGNAYLPYPKVGDYITGTNIPANTRILTHTKDTQTATLTANATGSGTSTASIRGAFDAFYDRCKAIKSATDFIVFSQNPTFVPELSGHARWITATPFVIGDRVTMRNADGTLTGTADGVYVCTAAHTSDATTKPESGASWATVWVEDLLDPASITAGTARCRAQALAQRNWAISNKESFVNGFGMFRNYGDAVAAGLMSTPDQVHPSSLGYLFKQIMFWSKIPISRLQLGTLGSFIPTDPSSASSHALGFPGTGHPSAVAASAELNRPLILGGTSSTLIFADRTSPNTGGNNISVSNTDAELSLGGAFITGKSSFSGLHPQSNGRTLGGRGSFFWNIGGAGLRLEYAEKTANYSILATDHTINVTSNSPTITLPDCVALNSTTGNFTNAAAGVMGKIYTIKNSGIGTVTVKGVDITRTSGVTNGTTTITYASNGQVPNVGDYVTGTDIPANTYIISAGSTSAVLSNAATGSSSGLTFTFNENIDGVASLSLAAAAKVTVQSTGTGWITI